MSKENQEKASTDSNVDWANPTIFNFAYALGAPRVAAHFWQESYVAELERFLDSGDVDDTVWFGPRAVLALYVALGYVRVARLIRSDTRNRLFRVQCT